MRGTMFESLSDRLTGVFRSFSDAASRIRVEKRFEPSENIDKNIYRNL